MFDIVIIIIMLNDLDTPYNLRNRIISKIMNISIRCTYYVFRRRNKDWTDPALMDLSNIFAFNCTLYFLFAFVSFSVLIVIRVK